MQLNFGKFKGQDISQVPIDYLQWGAVNLSQPKVKEAFKQEIYRRENPTGDGQDHINIYSKGETEIGRLLSNFAHTPFEHPEDGHFESVEGYWYFLGSGDEELRKLYGFKAKEYGRKINAPDWLDDEEFKRKIKLAIKCKIEQNKIDLSLTKNLPLKHYYNYKGNIVEPKEGKWVIEYIESLRNKKYNPLIFGKDQTERIVNITVLDDRVKLYIDSNGETIVRTEDLKPWALSNRKFNQSKELKGNKYYKYINHVPLERFNELKEEWDRSKWLPRSPEEAIMLEHGYTYYKGMTVDQVSVLSFDIEATGLNPEDKNAEVILISNTFRDRNGKITKKMFDIKQSESMHWMIDEWRQWVQEVNPDILIGHNILGYDLPYISTLAFDSLNLGRDETPIRFEERVSKYRKDGSQSYDYHNAHINGREIIDTLFLSIKYDIGRNFPSYGLKAIERHLNLVDDSRVQWDFEKYPTRDYKNWPEGKWEEFREYCRDDADSPLQMFDIMIPPFFYLCQSIPKKMQQMINEATGSQLDSLMVRSYLQDGWSQPRTSKKVDFEGAITMGNPGVYDNVRKVDVASLYPSIMLQYNIHDKKKDPQNYLIQMLDYFRTERLNNKKLAKDTGEQYYDDLQSAQKICINSLYGFMGANYLLYNYPEGAAEVTRYGREILQTGVEWATGCRLKKVIKSIKNEGKENEEIKYHWVVGDQISEGKGYELVNVDTDSFSYSGGMGDFNEEIKELNSLYEDHIVWEDDGVFDKVIVIKAKNYVLKTGNKIKYKGSSLTDQKKEPILIGFLEEVIDNILNETIQNVPECYKQFCQQALNPSSIKNWTQKKTITKAVLNPERANEQKVLDACEQAINAGVIPNIQEGDKVWLYQAIDGQKQKITKGEPVFLKDGTPKMVDNTILKFPELYDDDIDRWHYVKRVWDTLVILEPVLDLDKFIKYHLKSNRKHLNEKRT